MKFSESVWLAYRIKLSKVNGAMADAFFTGSGHHFWRSLETEQGSVEERFHIEMRALHEKALLMVIFESGSFDENGPDTYRNGRHRREAWSLDAHIPDDDYSSFRADPRFGVFEHHPNDYLLLSSNSRRAG